MNFKPSVAFKDGYFAAGDPWSIFSPFHWFRLMTEDDYRDGMNYSCKNRIAAEFIKSDKKGGK